MRARALFLATILAAPACSSAPRPEPSPPAPAAEFHPPPMMVADPRWTKASPPPSWIAATRTPEFNKCTACHNVEKDGKHGMGPNLYGVFGRPAASQPGYVYSQALRDSGLVWDAATLDRWLAGPIAFVPGARMTFSGEANPEKRKALIAFLRLRSASRP